MTAAPHSAPLPVSLAYANLLEPALGVGRGADPRRLAPGGDLALRFAEAHDRVARREAAGELGFLTLPFDQAGAETISTLADVFGQGFETLVVVGIGGSSLGGRALTEAILGPYWNEGTPEAREHNPRLYFLENADPASLTALLRRIDPSRTLFNIISKSGSTAETLALYLHLEAVVEGAVGAEKASGHFLFTTDPEVGPLRALARSRAIPALEVPPAVGGRFSVLSAVGLFPAALTGVDPTELLKGAAQMMEGCRTPVLESNPAGLLATLLHRAHSEGGQGIHVLMPYADRLRGLALWFQQLWAESLGKARLEDGTPGPVGPTPLPALGAVDQHSLLQLFMEGPVDKVVLFLGVKEGRDALPIPATHPGTEALAYLGGHPLGGLLEAERQATAEALRRAGRPSALLEIERTDPRALGGLFMLFQMATVYAGALYGVDPLDQPGVEEGKRLTQGLLGRSGVQAPTLSPEDDGGRRIPHL